MRQEYSILFTFTQSNAQSDSYNKMLLNIKKIKIRK